MLKFLSFLFCLGFAPLAMAGGSGNTQFNLHMTNSALGFWALGLFTFAYLLVMCEEFLHLRKSKPTVLTAGIVWGLVAWAAQGKGVSEQAVTAVRHNLLEYAELFLFLLVAMTYINAMTQRRVFDTLRAWLVRKGFNYRQLFWVTGFIAFFLSPIADNLTTALIMCAVVLAVGGENKRFISVSCINIVVAANAGGAFSPFGDITTLMVWQAGILPFEKFFHIFFPSLVSYIIPAMFMHFAIPNVQPDVSGEHVEMLPGAKRFILLFILTIMTAVGGHHFLHLPPVLGMMTGLAYLKIFSYFLSQKEKRNPYHEHGIFDIFDKVAQAEWDTLLFFYGVILCVGGLAAFGYLELVSNSIYHDWPKTLELSSAHAATPANSVVGVLSAIVDNIPVMFAVLTMKPAMSEGQWLLVTLTAGVGGSMLSIGSAAGVALMGQARGNYTFFSHIRWAWAIALGYIAGIGCHIWLNASMF